MTRAASRPGSQYGEAQNEMIAERRAFLRARRLRTRYQEEEVEEEPEGEPIRLPHTFHKRNGNSVVFYNLSLDTLEEGVLSQVAMDRWMKIIHDQLSTITEATRRRILLLDSHGVTARDIANVLDNQDLALATVEMVISVGHDHRNEDEEQVEEADGVAEGAKAEEEAGATDPTERARATMMQEKEMQERRRRELQEERQSNPRSSQVSAGCNGPNSLSLERVERARTDQSLPAEPVPSDLVKREARRWALRRCFKNTFGRSFKSCIGFNGVAPTKAEGKKKEACGNLRAVVLSEEAAVTVGERESEERREGERRAEK